MIRCPPAIGVDSIGGAAYKFPTQVGPTGADRRPLPQVRKTVLRRQDRVWYSVGRLPSVEKARQVFTCR